jgi:ABC-type bacteriocin/lantibiotic exporter with double-glycine peptidase domain
MSKVSVAAPPQHTQPFDAAVVSSSQTRTIGPTDRLYLSLMGGGFLVARGTVRIFAIELLAGGSPGRARPLFTCGQGSLLMGVEVGDARHVLVAVGAPRATVVPVALDDMRKSCESAKASARTSIPLIERWISRLVAAACPQTISTPVDELELGATISLEAGTIVTPGKRGLWLKPEEPALVWGQLVSSAIPGVSHVPVRFDSDARVKVMAGQEAIAQGDGWEGLRDLAQLCLRWLDEQTEKDSNAEAQRRRTLEEYERSLQRAIAGDIGDWLAGREGQRSAALLSTPLVAALRPVCRANGMVLEPPPPGMLEQSTDPLSFCARYSGFGVRRVALSPGWHKRDSGPLLGRLTDRQCVPLLWRRSGYQVASLGTRQSEPVTDEFDRRIAEAYEIYPSLPSGPQPRLAAWRFALSQHVGVAWLAVLAAILLGLSTPLPAYVFSFLRGDNGQDLSRTERLWLGAALTAWGVGIAALGVVLTRSITRVHVLSVYRLTAAAFHRIISEPLSFFRRRGATAVMGLLDAITGVETTALALLCSGGLGLSMLVFSLTVMALFYGRITLAAGAVAGVALALVVRNGAVRGRARRGRLEVEGEFNTFTASVIRAVSTVKVAGAEVRATLGWVRRYGTRQRHWQQEGGAAPSTGNWLLALVPTLVLVGVVDTGASPFTSEVRLATFGVFIVLILVSVALMATAIDAGTSLVEANRALRVIASEPGTLRGRGPLPGGVAGRIDVTDLTYREFGDGALLLDHVSFSVEPGEMVAIVGPSGAGKSTLLRVLLGIDDPTSGVVAYDGVDLVTLDSVIIRQQCGVVTQTSKLIHGTIRENVAGSRTLTDDQVRTALAMVGLTGFVQSLPMGLDTLVSDYSGVLSGGQQQLIILARALAGSPRMVFLDEATSALDNATQSTVMRAIEESEATRIVAAHRLSTIRQADWIIVLDRGRVVQRGTYNDLSTKPGLFQALIAHQDI